MNFAKYINVADAIKKGEPLPKNAYEMGVLDGVIITTIIACIVYVVMA